MTAMVIMIITIMKEKNKNRLISEPNIPNRHNLPKNRLFKLSSSPRFPQSWFLKHHQFSINNHR